ncbi:hypothetical protein ACT3SQ_11150 [Brachybacterium sp. AOP42-C2-15]|uniref:hypothetical protein n=1 Tax=unclassified Brachybacterium TaxID=2623841 RepID=UPI003F9363E9
MTAARSGTELLTLQALRLAGFADADVIADRALLPADEILTVIDQATRTGLVEPLSFAEAHGWILTDLGRAHLSVLLARDVDGAGAREVLSATSTEFERPAGINARFVETVSMWQLRSTSPVQAVPDAEGARELEQLLTALTALGRELRSLLAPLLNCLPRFGRYPAQYDIAVGRARTEGLRWVTGVGVLSCHAVWAELHQDLRSSTGEGQMNESAR